MIEKILAWFGYHKVPQNLGIVLKLQEGFMRDIAQDRTLSVESMRTRAALALKASVVINLWLSEIKEMEGVEDVAEEISGKAEEGRKHSGQSEGEAPPTGAPYPHP